MYCCCSFRGSGPSGLRQPSTNPSRLDPLGSATDYTYPPSGRGGGGSGSGSADSSPRHAGSAGALASGGSSSSRAAPFNSVFASSAPLSLSRKAKLPASSTVVLGGQSVELLPRNSTAEGESIDSRSSFGRLSKQQQPHQQHDSVRTVGAGSGGGGAGSSIGAESSSRNVRAVVVSPTAGALGDVVIGRPSTAVKVSEDAAKKVRLYCSH